MKIVLQMTVGRRRAFRSVFNWPDQIGDLRGVSSTSVNKCCDVAEMMIREVRHYVGNMKLGQAPVMEYNVNANPISKDGVEVA